MHVLAGIVLFAVIPAEAMPTADALADIIAESFAKNLSYPTTCAEEDNVNVPIHFNRPFPVSRPAPFSVVATDPTYSIGTDNCAPDFSGCSFFSTSESMRSANLSCQKLYDDTVNVIQLCTELNWWRPYDMTVHIGQNEARGHRLVISKKIEGEPSWPEVAVLYQDGYMRLKPHPAVGRADNCFGNSIIIGSAAEDSQRPYIDIQDIAIDPITLCLDITYVDSGKATVCLVVKRSSASAQVLPYYGTSNPFVTLRSMHVADGNCDVDRITMQGGTFPIMANWSDELTDLSWLFHREVRSIHNTSAPDVRITDTTIFVPHYYQSILGRAPDPDGRAYWESEIARILALRLDLQEAYRVLGGLFFGGTEYLGRQTSNEQYVTDLYLTFLNRDPDADGLSYWIQQLAAGLPRDLVMYGFLFSQEFDNYMERLFGDTSTRSEVNVIVDFYRGILGRLPDDEGFRYWLGLFRAAQCQGSAAVVTEVENISSAFINSPEYLARNRTDAQYVGDLYYAFLRRAGDLDGFNYWVDLLARGIGSREQVRQDFIQSAEFQERVSQMINKGCLP